MKSFPTFPPPAVLGWLLASLALTLAMTTSVKAADPLAERLVQKALGNFPGIQALKEKERKEFLRYDQVMSLPDPMAGVAYSMFPLDSWRLDKTPMSGLQLSWTQNIPWLPKLAAEGEMVRAMVKVRESETRMMETEARFMVLGAHSELYFLHHAQEIILKNKDILEQLNSVATTRYSVGEGIQYDLLKVQLQMSNLEKELIELDRMTESMQAELASWTGEKADSNLAFPDPFPLTDLNLTVAEGVRLMEASHPKLRMYREMKAAADRKEERAKLAWYPDFEVQGGYRYRSDVFMKEDRVDMGEIMVGVMIPIFNKGKRAAVTEAQTEGTASLLDLAAAERMLTGQLEAALSRLREIRRLLELYATTLIPQAEQAFESAQSAYQVGKADFMTVIDSQMKLLMQEQDVYRLQAEYEKTIARIEFLTGVPAGQMKPSSPEESHE